MPGGVELNELKLLKFQQLNKKLELKCEHEQN